MLSKLRAAIGFYTCLPVLGREEPLDFQGIALYAPAIGAGMGVVLAAIDSGLAWVSPHGLWLRALVLILTSIWLTGGLHLDGAMDTGDGLGVTDPDRRLEVMADSRTGAFGAMVLVSILLMKLVALAVLVRLEPLAKIWLFANVGAWARWGQLHAIGTFAYLKAEGKGKIHRNTISQFQVWGLASIGIVLNFGISWLANDWGMGLFWNCLGLIPLFLSTWFNHKLGGHTGDTYGAVVEWSEALIFLAVALVIHRF